MPQNVYIYRPDVRTPTDVQYVEIPDGITVIRKKAFYGCTDLRSVTIPDSVTEIEDNAFSNCSALQSVVIPDSVTAMGACVFSDCSGLRSAVISKGITQIRDLTFSACHSLQSVTIPRGVTKIGDDAFRKCLGLQSVIIPDSVTEIGFYAFAECSGLQSVTLPDGVTEIAPAAFYRCSALRLVILPGGIKEIGSNVFSACSALRSVSIPDSVTKIGDRAFSYCYRLQSVTIPDGVTEIARSAFLRCFELQSVTIPDSVRKIGTEVFRDCRNLRSVMIPDGVTEIGEFAFSDCSELQSVTLSDSVRTIGQYAFFHCDNLQSVALPAGITQIRNNTFASCNNLQSVTISGGVTEIAKEAFRGCINLRSVTIPDGVIKIGNRTFDNCASLQTVAIPDSVTEIESEAFSNCQELQSVTLPEGIKKIETYAFANDSGLLSVTMPDSVVQIDDFAFHNCSELQHITIPAGVTEIGYAAFRNCQSLQSVTLPDGLKLIGGSAFCMCSELRSVTIPDSVKKIEGCAFSECSKLQQILIPDSVTDIGDGAFRDCRELRSVIFKGINIYPLINIDGYGAGTFQVIKALIKNRIPVNENNIKCGIRSAHDNRLDNWISEYPLFGCMRPAPAMKTVSPAIKKELHRCFTEQHRTGYHVPKILQELAITAHVCGIPAERMASHFDIGYTKNILGKHVPIVPAEACRCYYNRNICDMLIRKDRIAIMAEAIGLYNASDCREYYKYAMDFIVSHPDTKTETLLHAVRYAKDIPMTADTTPEQVRQHCAYTKNLAEVTKIEAKYEEFICGFKLTDYPCNIRRSSAVYNGMKAAVLDLSDEQDVALAAGLGRLTNCCQRLNEAGETAMMHGFLNPDAGFWVVLDRNGIVKAQAEIWEADPNTLVFDNIEFANTDNEHLYDRAEQFRGIIAAWAMKSGYRNIIMGCGYNEMEFRSMEPAPVPELRLTPEEVYALQEDNDAGVSFADIDKTREYMQTENYNPNDFVYTDANEQCVYIKKDGVVSDYLMKGYDDTLTEERCPSGQTAAKEQEDGVTGPQR